MGTIGQVYAVRFCSRARHALAIAVLGVFAACADAPPVRFSEVHYHPVLEDDYEERHEFIELFNDSGQAVDLSGWKVVGSAMNIVLPKGTSIGAGEYRVIAKDRERLAAVWGLDAATLLGDYEGELDNGRETLTLLDASGSEVDQLEYDDDAPWPVAADAMGAGDDWLDPSLLPLDRHRYKGHSLERISFSRGTSDPSNWAPSPLDGATPGKANASSADTPPVIVLDRERTAGTGGNPDELVATLSKGGEVKSVELEYFVDDIARTNEAVTTVAMAASGGQSYAAQVPAVAPGVVVRYRIRADLGKGSEILSPRATDPYRWHAYAKTPEVATSTRTYHLLISPANWGQLWTNLQGGRDSGCTVNPLWNNEVPAVLLHGDKVYDVRARYQGSRYNRTNGTDITTWPYPRPSTGPMRVLSWRLSFPRYKRFEGRGELILSKNRQGCPGYDAGVGFRLFREAGVPAPETRYARLHINGGYYHYALEIERPGEDMVAKLGPVGDLFKSIGGAVDGAYGTGDERLLPANCGLTPRERYTLTYDRKTHNQWGKPDPIIELITQLHMARAQGVAAERAYFQKYFDVNRLLDHMVVMNWSVPFDDMFHNHFLYRQRDGKWLLMPWDLDINFGAWAPASSSLYIGQENDPGNRNGQWNYVKDTFLRAYRSEFNARLRQMVDGPLAPALVQAKVDEWTAQANPAEAMAAPTGLACPGFPQRAASWKQFATDRAAIIKQRLP